MSISILNDREIVEECMFADSETGLWGNKPSEQSMIYPFIPVSINSIESTAVHDGGVTHYKEKVVSYGVSSFGYDARLAPKFKVFTPVVLGGAVPIVDPKNLDTRYFVDYEGDSVILPPHSFMLGHTIEYFRIPRNIMVVCLGKSTYARCGLIVNVTPLEAGWEGQVTIEISNTTPLPAKVYANEGIAQFLFFQGNQPAVSYADRRGKYQGQTGVTPSKV